MKKMVVQKSPPRSAFARPITMIRDAYSRCAETVDDHAWKRSFANTPPEFLAAFAAEVRAEIAAGRTEPLDPDRL